MKKILFILAITSSISHFQTKCTYYSQIFSMQDKFLNENIFHNKQNGVFVDIGAHDGISLSNTYFFEKELHWTGICIEPNPNVFQKLCKNRNCFCIQACIADKNGEVDFLQISGAPEMLSGIAKHYDARHVNRINYELQTDGGSSSIIKVKAVTFNDLLRKHNLYHIDYLSIDTEGGEFEILKAIDFETFDIDIIDVENNYNYPYFKTFLESKGFVLIARLHLDEIYRNKKYLNK